jgi:hypothetical protein
MGLRLSNGASEAQAAPSLSGLCIDSSGGLASLRSMQTSGYMAHVEDLVFPAPEPPMKMLKKGADRVVKVTPFSQVPRLAFFSQGCQACTLHLNVWHATTFHKCKHFLACLLHWRIHTISCSSFFLRVQNPFRYQAVSYFGKQGTDILAGARAAESDVVLTDLSHWGVLEVRGNDRLRFINSQCTNKLSTAAVMDCKRASFVNKVK